MKKTHKIFICTALTSVLIFFLSACVSGEISQEDTSLWKVSSSTFSHDPSIIYADGYYHQFYTANGIGHSYSLDGKNWSGARSVFTMAPRWWKTYVPSKTDFNTWAPDVVKYNDKYYVFYSVSTFGSNTSCIGLASTTDLMSNVWEDLGVVMASSTSDTYNCIDPSFIEDSGKTYMAFGSWWKGLYIIELDSTTLKVKDNSKPVLLASREASSNAIEGVTIFKENNYYYLLASYDLCCRGTQSTYSTRYGRSENLFGPYIDEKGKEMIKGGGTILLSSKGTRIGPGGEDVFKTENGSWALCAHYYDALQNGRATLLIKDLNFTEDFWLY